MDRADEMMANDQRELIGGDEKCVCGHTFEQHGALSGYCLQHCGCNSFTLREASDDED